MENGLQLGGKQWGTTDLANGKTEITLPVSFAASAYTIVATIQYENDIGSKVYSVYAHILSTSKISVYRDGWPTSGDNLRIMWIAVGK